MVTTTITRLRSISQPQPQCCNTIIMIIMTTRTPPPLQSLALAMGSRILSLPPCQWPPRPNSTANTSRRLTTTESTSMPRSQIASDRGRSRLELVLRDWQQTHGR